MPKSILRNLFTNMWITMWKTMPISTADSRRHGHTWISTALLLENTQVLHTYVAKKDINLLILQPYELLLTTYVKA